MAFARRGRIMQVGVGLFSACQHQLAPKTGKDLGIQSVASEASLQSGKPCGINRLGGIHHNDIGVEFLRLPEILKPILESLPNSTNHGFLGAYGRGKKVFYMYRYLSLVEPFRVRLQLVTSSAMRAVSHRRIRVYISRLRTRGRKRANTDRHTPFSHGKAVYKSPRPSLRERLQLGSTAAKKTAGPVQKGTLGMIFVILPAPLFETTVRIDDSYGTARNPLLIIRYDSGGPMIFPHPGRSQIDTTHDQATIIKKSVTMPTCSARYKGSGQD
ncbi:hypothetical protein QBC46DRAFT_418304 [Diplogelasinospora grovesii]|uniref:Uncharacterized protein n=1 Tax=Diplogelasinospora grovesii TaxID=303347 RepID=A0AAN6S1V3_9PEZI|nr:hypothetical protein QBC46DRAFT_418304 [Diplogelasinospora grovesii]